MKLNFCAPLPNHLAARFRRGWKAFEQFSSRRTQLIETPWRIRARGVRELKLSSACGCRGTHRDPLKQIRGRVNRVGLSTAVRVSKLKCTVAERFHIEQHRRG